MSIINSALVKKLVFAHDSVQMGVFVYALESRQDG